MGASLPSGGGGRNGRFSSKFQKNRGKGQLSDINVTPLVDVMLVLLIVFMVAAPMLTTGVSVKLPQSAAKPVPTSNQEPLTVSVKENGDVFLQKSSIAVNELVARLEAVTANRSEGKEEKIFIRADKNVNYGAVMSVMGELNAGGFNKLSLLTEPKP